MKKSFIGSIFLIFCIILITGCSAVSEGASALNGIPQENILSQNALTDPVKIEAESYSAMYGIKTEACTEGTLNVGWIDVGDWLEYRFNAPAATQYKVDFRVASQFATGKFDMMADGQYKTTLFPPNTGGWQNWTTITATVNLPAGNQTIRLNMTGPSFNLNWLTFTPVIGSSSSLISSEQTSSLNSSSLSTMNSQSSSSAAVSSAVSSILSGNGLSVQTYQNGTTGGNTQYIRINLQNKGSSAINLSTAKVRYYLLDGGYTGWNAALDYSVLGSANISFALVSLTPAQTGANRYLEITFSSGAGNLAPGGSAEIQGRIYRSDWANFNAATWYSYNPSTTYVNWDKVTGYSGDALVWGIEPGNVISSVSSKPSSASRSSLSSSQNSSSSSGSFSSSSSLPEPYPIPDYKTVQISESVIKDKIKGGWVLQSVGCDWGAPTEFYARYVSDIALYKTYTSNMPLYKNYTGGMIPVSLLPAFHPNMGNDYLNQDDIYVELPFLDTYVKNGVNAGWKALADNFNNNSFIYYHGNLAARDNIKKNIYPPESGHYKYNGHCNDIDFQIECNSIGLSSPAMVNVANEMAWRTGHVMGYGDGVYGGVFVCAMQARSFTATSIDEIIQAGRTAVPRGSKYRTIIEEVLYNKQQGLSWQSNYELIANKWLMNDDCVEWNGSELLNIDAKYNGFMVLMGLLYGNGDFSESMKISMSCGQDSDCNPSTIASILGSYFGYSRIPSQYVANVNTSRAFNGYPSQYTFNSAMTANLETARQAVIMAGGSAPINGTWTIRYIESPSELILEQWPSDTSNPPVLNAKAIVLPNKQVAFIASVGNPDSESKIQWFFGDLNYATLNSCTYTYSKAGSYEAVCYATDRKGNTSYKKFNLSVQ